MNFSSIFPIILLLDLRKQNSGPSVFVTRDMTYLESLSFVLSFPIKVNPTQKGRRQAGASEWRACSASGGLCPGGGQGRFGGPPLAGL